MQLHWLIRRKKLFIVINIYNKFVRWLFWWIFDAKIMKTGYVINFYYLGPKTKLKGIVYVKGFFIGKCDRLTYNGRIDLWYGITPFDTWIFLLNLTKRELDKYSGSLLLKYSPFLFFIFYYYYYYYYFLIERIILKLGPRNILIANGYKGLGIYTKIHRAPRQIM